MTFTPPAKSMQFLIRHSEEWKSILATDLYQEIDEELVGDILQGAAQFSSDVIAPTNWNGDQNPCRLEDDKVSIPPGFKAAYKDFVDAAWQSVATPAEIGGMGLPQIISVATNEMIYACLLYTSPSPRDQRGSRMPSSA